MERRDAEMRETGLAGCAATGDGEGIDRMVIAFDENRIDFLNLIGKAAENSGTLFYPWSLTANHAHRLLRSGSAGVPTAIRNMLMI
ncbi:MAG: hypothetical protein HGA56_07985 [Chlorobiaceae bacterium]|nr:hypothetical protein [Chlorobiaceae bacterium]